MTTSINNVSIQNQTNSPLSTSGVINLVQIGNDENNTTEVTKQIGSSTLQANSVNEAKSNKINIANPVKYVITNTTLAKYMKDVESLPIIYSTSDKIIQLVIQYDLNVMGSTNGIGRYISRIKELFEGLKDNKLKLETLEMVVKLFNTFKPLKNDSGYRFGKILFPKITYLFGNTTIEPKFSTHSFNLTIDPSYKASIQNLITPPTPTPVPNELVQSQNNQMNTTVDVAPSENNQMNTTEVTKQIESSTLQTNPKNNKYIPR